MKKFLSLALATALCFSLASPALAIDISEDTFPAVNEYVGYADVAESDWFYANAKLCYEVGLMEGSNIGFEPNATMTTAQVFAITARMAESILGYSLPTDDGSDTWYAPYVTFLSAMGIPVPEDIEAPITRFDFLTLLAAVIPEELLAPINEITTLPDTDDANVLAFYNAGILTGMDSYGTFDGDKTLTRAEASAMLSRIVREELRVSFVPAEKVEEEAVDYSLQLLGLSADTICFTAGDYALTAQDLLPYMVNNTLALSVACTADGYDFDWNLYYGDITLAEYVLTYSMVSALQNAWIMDTLPAVELTEEDETYLAELDPMDYIGLGMSYDQYVEVVMDTTARWESATLTYGETELDEMWESALGELFVLIVPTDDFYAIDLDTFYASILSHIQTLAE